MRARQLLLTLILALAATTGIANAEVRTAVIQDPMDTRPTVSGIPNSPDIRQVSVRYDTSGTIEFTADFYNAPSGLDLSEKYAFVSKFQVGSNDGDSYYRFCSGTNTGDISGQHHVFASTGLRFFDESAVSGYDGKLQFTRSTSADGRSVTVRATSPTIANRNFECFNYYMLHRTYSTASNLSSSYDGSCDCWYNTGYNDVLGVTHTNWYDAVNYFDGYSPIEPPSVEPPAVKVRSRFRLRPVPQCRRLDVSYWTLLPDRVHGAKRPWSGRFEFVVRGKGVRRTKTVRVRSFIYLTNLGPGTYTLSARYLGDRWRLPSKTLVQRVRIPRC